MNFPAIGTTEKFYASLSGGRKSRILVEQLDKHYDLSNCTALFIPIRELANKQNIETKKQDFIDLCNEYSLEYKLYDSLSDYDMSNGDNIVSDRHRYDVPLEFAKKLNISGKIFLALSKETFEDSKLYKEYNPAYEPTEEDLETYFSDKPEVKSMLESFHLQTGKKLYDKIMSLPAYHLFDFNGFPSNFVFPFEDLSEESVLAL